MAFFCRRKGVSEDGWMKLVQQTGAEHARLNRDHGRIGRTVELPVQASFSNVLRLNSIVFRNSACANRIVMAASMLLGAAAARVIPLAFAAGHR